MGCPNCNGPVLWPDGLLGEKVCADCGLTAGPNTNVQTSTYWHPEWNSNWNEEDSETVKEWLTILRTVSSQLCLPNFPYREEAARTIRKGRRIFAKSQKLGKNKRATVAALVHLTLKEYGKTRPLKEICQVLSLDRTLVMKQAWVLNKEFCNHISHAKTKVLCIMRKTAKDYLLDLGVAVTKNKATLDAAQQTLERVRAKGGNPIGVAAGALYFAMKLNEAEGSKGRIAQEFGISERTVETNELRIRRLMERRTFMGTEFSLPFLARSSPVRARLVLA